MEDFRVDLGIFLNPENLQTVQSQIDSLSSRNVTLKINTQDVLKDVNLIKQQLKSIGVDFGGATGVSTAVKKEMAEVEKTVGKTTNIVSKKLKLDFADALGKNAWTSLDGVREKAEEAFGKIGSITIESVREANDEIKEFIISVKNSIGEVEKLRYILDKEKNKEGEIVVNGYKFDSSRATDNNIKREEEATRKATQAQKEYEAQISKNNATVTKYTADLTSLQSKYTDLNAAKPITDTTHTEALETQYQNATRAVEALKSADKDTFTELKANADAEIQKLKDMVTQFRNAEYAANQLRAKPVETIKINEGYALDEFEAKVRQAGITSQEFYQRIVQLRTQLSNVGDKQSLTEYLNVLSNVKAESQALIAQKKTDDQQAAQSQKGINEVFQRTLELEKQIGRTKVKIAGLDPEKDKAQIAELNNQLNTLVNESQLVKGEFSSAFSKEQILKLNDVIKETENRIAEIKAQLQAAQSQKVAEIKTNFSNGQYEKEVNAVKTSFDGLRNTTTELQTAMNGLDTAYENLKTAQAGSDPQKLVVAEEAYVNALKKVKNQLDINTRTEREQISAEKMAQGKQALYSQIDVWLKNNSAAAKKFGAELREIQAQLKGTDAVDLKALRAQFQETTRQAKILGVTGKSLKDQFSQTFKTLGMYFSSTALIMRGVQYVRQMYDNVLKVDTAMTGLYRVTNLTGEQYTKLYDDMTESAKKYGAELSNIIDLNTSWIKLGFDSSIANRLSEISTMYQHVADVDESTAAENLVTAYKGFQETLDEKYGGDATRAIEHVTDVYDKLNNEFAVTAADVGDAMQRSASSLQMAGNSFEQSAGMATGITEVIQDAEKAGSTLNIVSLRLRGMKGELEELGEEVDENIESISKMQTHILNLTNGKVNIFGDNGEFRSTYEIMKDIANVYDELDSKAQADLLETVAGKMRANAVSALISNFDQVEKATEAAYNSAGTAAKENEKFMDSMQGKINATKASWQALSNTVMSSDFLKGLIDVGGTALGILNEIVDTLGTLPTILITIGSYLAIKNVGILKELPNYIKNLNDTGAALKALSKIDIGVVGVNYGNIDAYQKAIKGLNAEQAVAVLSSKKLNAAQIEEIMTTESATLAKGTYTQADVQAALAKQGLTTATSVLTTEQQAEIINSGLLTSDKLAEVAATLGLETAESGALVSKKALNLETVKQQLTSIGVIGTQQEQILTLLGLVGAESAATGATNILTGAFNALKASMAAHPIGWIIAGVAALVAGLITLKSWIDKNKEAEAEAIKQAHEDAKTALDNSKSDLQNVQSELSSVKSELSGINDEIKGIASKGKLDFVDQKQITKLAQQKQLLEQNQRILENNEKMTARQTASEAKKLLDTEVENKYYLPRGGSTVGTYNYEQTVKNQIDSLNQIYDLYNDYLSENTEGTNKYLPQIRQQITNQKDAITGTINDLYDIVNSFKYSDGTIIEGYEDIYTQYMGYINNLQSLTDPDMFYQIIQDTDKKVTGIDLEKIYQQLIQDAYAGKFDINKVNEDFIKALESQGISRETIEQIFKNRQQEYQRILNNIDYAFDYENVQPQRDISGGYYPRSEKYQNSVKKGYMTGEQAAKQEATKEKEKLKTIHDTLKKYAQENPIDYQVIATYDDDNFNKLKDYVDEEFKKTGDYATATTNAIQDLKNEMSSTDNATNEEFLLDIDTIESQIDGLKDNIDSIASAYQDMMSIIDDYNENGTLSVDNLETLIELGDDYIGTLFNENGELELNKDSYIALAKAKLEDIRYSMLEKAISEINALSKDNEATETDSLADSTGNLTEKTLQLVAAQKLAEGVDSSKINAIMQTYYQWDALIDNVVVGLDENTDATLGVSDATDEATDSSDAYEDALNAEKDALEDSKDALEDQKDALEDTKDGYEDAIDNIKELIDWVQDYIKQIKNDEIDALEAKKDKIDDLIEAQKDLLNAEKDEYDWQKTITDKQNTVAKDALAASIASLDNSSAGKKAQKQTAETLADSRKDIIDELYDHSIDERLDYLDTLKDEQDTYYDEQIDKINDYLNNEVQLYKDACEMIDNDSGDLYGKLLWYCQNYTTTSEAEFNHMWSSAQSAMQQYNTANLGTFDLLNNLQGRIYEVDTAIDTVSQSISEYEDAIDAVQTKIDDLGDAAEDTINKINNIKTVSANGNWYVDYNGKRYSSFFDNKNDAINDLRKQVTQSLGFNATNPLLINDNTVKHYASGTRRTPSTFISQENGLEAIFAKNPNGAGTYTITTPDSQVFDNKRTDNLYDFASDPEKFLSEKGLSPLSQEELANLGLWGDSSQLGMINSAFGVGGLSGLIEKITGGSGISTNNTSTTNDINPIVNIYIQGDADQSVVNALEKQADSIVQRTINQIMKIPVRNKFVI